MSTGFRSPTCRHNDVIGSDGSDDVGDVITEHPQNDNDDNDTVTNIPVM